MIYFKIVEDNYFGMKYETLLLNNILKNNFNNKKKFRKRSSLLIQSIDEKDKE